MENVYVDIRQYEKYHVGRYLKEEFKKDNVSIDDLMGVIEELLAENERLEERYEDRERDIEDNFRRISPESMYG